VVVRRGRWKKVCARCADVALLRGRSASPLERTRTRSGLGHLFRDCAGLCGPVALFSSALPGSLSWRHCYNSRGLSGGRLRLPRIPGPVLLNRRGDVIGARAIFLSLDGIAF